MTALAPDADTDVAPSNGTAVSAAVTASDTRIARSLDTLSSWAYRIRPF
jgi:hypothetical protein